jgi:hypothetical protein
MERVVVVGNCQAKALETLLATNATFAAGFEFTSFPAVHELPATMIGQLHAAVAEADVLVAQKVDDGYRDGLGLGTATLSALTGAHTVVRWPSLYWAGYVPDLFYLRDPAGQLVVDAPFDYHDRAILEAYAGGLDVRATCLLLADSDRPSQAPAWAENATAELAIRGQGCDVDLGAFIASRFRDELLFFTMNHPTKRVLGHVADEVLAALDIRGGADPRAMPGETLDSTFYPLHANHVRSLGLAFGPSVAAGRTPFRIRGETLAATDAVGAFFAYYDANPQLVATNLAGGDSR